MLGSAQILTSWNKAVANNLLDDVDDKNVMKVIEIFWLLANLCDCEDHRLKYEIFNLEINEIIKELIINYGALGEFFPKLVDTVYSWLFDVYWFISLKLLMKLYYIGKWGPNLETGTMKRGPKVSGETLHVLLIMSYKTLALIIPKDLTLAASTIKTRSINQKKYLQPLKNLIFY